MKKMVMLLLVCMLVAAVFDPYFHTFVAIDTRVRDLNSGAVMTLRAGAEVVLLDYQSIPTMCLIMWGQGYEYKAWLRCGRLTPDGYYNIG